MFMCVCVCVWKKVKTEDISRWFVYISSVFTFV